MCMCVYMHKMYILSVCVYTHRQKYNYICNFTLLYMITLPGCLWLFPCARC